MTQRAYRAACPNCGAPVEFTSAASASAVCSFCRSTLVRDGEALRRIGVSAELFDDHSPLQLGAAGQYKGMGFTLVGRLQYAYSAGPRAPTSSSPLPQRAAGPAGGAGPDFDGTWNEWHALFASGRSGWLSEDNGAYVFAFDAGTPADLPEAKRLSAGQPLRVDGRDWTVASVVQARLLAAQGELPSPPRLDGEFVVADLRNTQDEVGTLDYSDPAHPNWSTGRSVTLVSLAMIGLREASEKSLSGRAFECPGCGNNLQLTLSTTQSIACGACGAVVDVSKGVGGELQHYAQNNSPEGGLEPQIPLGSSGKLALGGKEPESWQVVGYQERCDIPEPGSDDEQSFWREYLLYNREAGFAFLVDTDEGWSWVKPLTGTPKVKGQQATWQGITYQQRWRYRAKVTWVQGEFYWRVRRDEVALVTDYQGGASAASRRLSSEKTPSELTWSAGETLAADRVASAFSVSLSGIRRDAAPLSIDVGKAQKSVVKMALILFGILVLIAIISSLADDGCDSARQTFGEASAEYRQCLNNRSSGGSRGGSFGGFSSGGGGHK